MIDPTQSLSVNTDLVAGEVVDGEAVIINLGNGMYYTMAETGAEVWQLIERGLSAHAIAETLASRYALDRHTVLADLAPVIAELVTEQLVVAASGASDAASQRAASAVLGPAVAPYAKPALHRYSDMSEVLALDPPLPALGALRRSQR